MLNLYMKRSAIAALSAGLILAGCGGNEEAEKESGQEQSGTENHEHMDHSGSPEVLEELKTAENPQYPVGEKAIIKEGHMEGMKNAEATIVGAYSTTVYEVSYDPVDGGNRVNNHKWVIHEELKDPEAEAYTQGDKVILDADHMEGMKGAEATVDSAKQTTVYMIDFTPTDGSGKVTNHKWVTEDELSPAE